MDSEKGNRVFARGHNVPPPWFLEPQKSLVWIGLRQDPLDLIFWSFLTFLHHGIEEVERHLP